MTGQIDRRELQREIADFRTEFSVVFIATVDGQGKPESSHAPFVADENGGFCVLISRLARHTQNLLEKPQASVLLLETSENSPNPFALRRLQFDCEAVFLQRGSVGREGLIQLMRERFGRFVDTLDSLGDFEMVSLRPLSGKFVRGFAQTFELSGENLEQVVHVNPAQIQGGG